MLSSLEVFHLLHSHQLLFHRGSNRADCFGHIANTRAITYPIPVIPNTNNPKMFFIIFIVYSSFLWFVTALKQMPVSDREASLLQFIDSILFMVLHRYVESVACEWCIMIISRMLKGLIHGIEDHWIHHRYFVRDENSCSLKSLYDCWLSVSGRPCINRFPPCSISSKVLSWSVSNVMLAPSIIAFFLNSIFCCIDSRNVFAKKWEQ